MSITAGGVSTTAAGTKNAIGMIAITIETDQKQWSVVSGQC
jgi:hypothetical protein